VHDLAELYGPGDFGQPAAGTPRVPDLTVRGLGGAWAAGRMLHAVEMMMDAHPRGALAVTPNDPGPV
jgi:hypothetical protein